MQHQTTITLVDVENMATSGRFDESVAKAMRPLLDHFYPGGLGKVVIGTGNGAQLMTAKRGFGDAQCVLGKGRNGADRALASFYETHYYDAQVETLVICSGDFYFAETARSAQRRGARVVVISVNGKLSRELASAADDVILIPEPSQWQYHLAA